MNPNYRPTRGLAFCVPAALRRHATALFSVALVATAWAQSAGKITGRLYNPATGQYVRNAEVHVKGTDIVAYSGDDGFYELDNVPAGATNLTVTFTGYDSAAATVN